MNHRVTSKQLTNLDTDHVNVGPHVVILGAGASLAAFPNGDRSRRELPVMANFVKKVGLEALVHAAGGEPSQNFESFYSGLVQDESRIALCRQLESDVYRYFSEKEIPSSPTLYDLLLMTLRPKDAIATFNWDPFLVEAYRRSEDPRRLPQLLFLHGNVRVSVCLACSNSFCISERCPTCQEPGEPTRLLFPVEKKNHSNDPFIAAQWSATRSFLGDADRLTIFGYGAPATDSDAKEMLRVAWHNDHRITERIEIIDIQTRNELQNRWDSFSRYHRFDTPHSFFESSLARFPRRSCEALAHQGIDGQFTDVIPWAGSMTGAWDSVRELIEVEVRLREEEGR